MAKESEKVRQFLLYGVDDEHAFIQNERWMDESNIKLWTRIAIAGIPIFLFLFIGSFFINSLAPQMFIYAVMFGLSLIGFLLLHYVKKVKTKTYIVQALMVITYGLAVVLANYGDLSMNAVTIMVVLIIVPITYIGRPYRVFIMTETAAIGEIITACLVKSGNIRSMDITNCVIFAVISIFINSYLLKGRINNIINSNVLRRMAYVDSLTGLGNEFSYLERKEILDKEIKDGSNKPFGVAMFDVNNLKKTNDTYGHVYGCSLVVETGHYIRSIFKTSQCYHIGGDEFLVMIRGDEDLKRIDEIIALFDKSMEDYYITKNNIRLRLTIARGYSMFDKEKDKCFSDVLNRADELMYKNKAEVKEKYHLGER